MKFAILLRGFHAMERDRHGFRQDYRESIDSYRESVLKPLQQRGTVDVYLATYPQAPKAELEAAFQPKAMWLGDPKQSTQVESFCHGLDLIINSGIQYDRIICTRFDLRYLKPINDWDIWHETQHVYLLWREHPIWWERFKTTGDFIHVIDAPYVKGFREALEYFGRSRTDLHPFYSSLKKYCGEPRFMDQGFYTSDPMYSSRYCKNPLYRIPHRPDLWTPNFNISSTFLGGIGWALDKIVQRLTGKRLETWEIQWRLKRMKKAQPQKSASAL